MSLASSYPSQCCWTAMIACWTRFDASLTGLPFEQLHRQNGVVLHIVKPSAHELVLEALGVKEGGTATGAGRVLGPEHRDTLMSMNNLANMLFVEGRYDEAEKLQRDTLDIQRRVLGPDHPDAAMSTYNLGGIALQKGKPDEALSLLRNAVDHGLAPNIALYMEKDPDLELLHGDPRFATLVAHAKEHAAAAQKTN